MATFVYGMQVSLDGHVDHDSFQPDETLFRHWIDHVGAIAGSLYGRRLYELMRYWDDDQPQWGAPEREFADAWRRQPKWVVSNTLTSVGPNATLISGDVEPAIRALKQQQEGEIDIGGPVLARSLTEWGLIDEYRLYLFPAVTGGGNRFFRGPVPPLRLTSHHRIGDVVRLCYVPA
ncbi:MAG TPA: dihydrofolate reductase family protein [Rhizobiaceae bacterium]|nr:dihydrofolate reductase family protein [Rhizobiaceae bacterium]